MIIHLSPVRSDEALPTLSVAGDVLTLNGVAFDFGPLPEGASLPAAAVGSGWFVGEVGRLAGELHVTLKLPHGRSPSQAVAFPAPLVVSDDGPITLPFDPPFDDEPGSTQGVANEH